MIGIEKNKLLFTAIEACIKGGESIMEVYNSNFKVEIKDDKSPLTQADKNANDVINSFLNQTGIPIISEENRQIDFSERKDWQECWIVDPLDGTKEFVKRNGEFTVNIALVRKGKPVIGVIYVPVTQTLYFADVDLRASYKLRLTKTKGNLSKLIENFSQKLTLRDYDTKLIRVVGSRSHMNQETLSFVEKLKQSWGKVEIVSKGSSLKFCLVAENEADIYPRFAPTMEWDTAAGQAICNALDIDVVSAVTDKELTYNKENLLNPWFMVKRRNAKI